MTPMADGPFNFTHYWSFVEFEMYVELIVRDYPNLVKKEVIGKSIEGRDIIALKVSLDAEFGNQPIIFVDSGTHARYAYISKSNVNR